MRVETVRSCDVEPAPDIEAIDPGSAAIDEVVDLLRADRPNGSAFVRCFPMPQHIRVRWSQARRYQDEVGYVRRFLTRVVALGALPDMDADRLHLESARFEWTSSFTLDGEIARLLVAGGAYREFAGPPAAAKELGGRFVDGIFGDRFLDVEVYQSRDPWSSWFLDVAWDATFVIVDTTKWRTWVVAVTDTD